MSNQAYFILVFNDKVLESHKINYCEYNEEIDEISLSDGTLFGGLQADYFVTYENYQEGYNLTEQELEELENNGLKEQYLRES